MASGGSDRQTGTVPKTKARNNCNVPQEVVTPTRRDIHSTNIMTTSVDWLPVSEHNTRSSQNKSHKPTNIPTDNDFAELDSSTTHEGGSRFVPVRPQPRTLVLRQRDLLDSAEESASYGSILGGHSPHTSHTAIMIVNPTTPNSNQNMNSSGSGARNNVRGSSSSREGSYSNTAPVCPHPAGSAPKPTNVPHDPHDSVYQNGSNGQTYGNENMVQNQQEHNMLPRTEAARSTGDSMVAACPDTARVEQRLGQIREYIRVTSTLVDSMRNSEDELRSRLISLRRCNDLLMGTVGSVCQEPERDEREEPDSDVADLMTTLSHLRDSEKKLEDILTAYGDKWSDDEDESIPESKAECHALETAKTSESSQNQDSEVSVLKDWTPLRSNDSVTITDVTEVSESSLKDQEAIPRPPSAQSSVSAYSDNDLWQNELKANMEISQLRLAAALQEQKRLLKYQAEAKEQLAEMHLSRNGHQEQHPGVSGGDLHEQQHQGSSGPPNYHHQPLAQQAAARVYGSNQIGVATTLPHVTDGNLHNNNYNWNNQGARKRASSSRERELNDRTLSTVREPSETRSSGKGGVAVAVVSSDQAEIDMLRDLQMRRQHLESQFQSSQVAKIQNLHAATSSLADAVSLPPIIDNVGAVGGQGGRGDGGSQEGGRGGWGGSEASEEEGGTIENTIRNKVAAVNVMKVELERLKSMLRTVDSIQNNFGINSTFDEEHMYDNTPHIPQENHNRNQNRASESSVNNAPLCRTDSSSSSKVMKDGQSGAQNSGANSKNQNTPLGLSRLQNCISSGSNKCTNVSEQNQATGDSVGSGLAAIQQLTHELKQAAQGLSEERRRLKHATNRDTCMSSGSSIKSEDKKRTNSLSGGNTSANTVVSYPPYGGPVERRQLALKAELEAKKKQLERLMSKDVDHRTNQQSLALDQSAASKATPSGVEEAASLGLPVGAGLAGAPAVEDDCACSALTMRTDIDNGYSSDQDDDEAYLSSSRNQLNINQLSGAPSHKLPSRGSSIDNFKDTSYFGDSTQSLDGSFASQSMKHNKPGGPGRAGPSSSKQHNREPALARTLMDLSQEMQEQRTKGLGEPAPQPMPDCFLTLPVSNNGGTGRNKDPCDVSNVSNVSSGSTSEGDPVPPPMATLPPRHPSRHIKNNHEHSNPDMVPPQWHNPHSESQVTMWWHNKANQLQQQLEMTSNLCQSLLQDKRTGQMTPSTLNSSSQTTQVPNSILLPNYQNNNTMSLPTHSGHPNYPNYAAANPVMFQNYANNPMFMPPPNMGMGGMMMPNFGQDVMMSGLGAGGQLWALQQQQAAAQQQVAAAAWGSAHCIQHLLSQQREISSLRSTVSNLEERLQTLNLNMPRAHSTPPHVNFPENTLSQSQLGARAHSAQSGSQSQYWNIQSQANLSNIDTSNTNAAINPQFNPAPPPGLANVHPSNLNQSRAPKVTPNIPPFPVEHFNNQLPANFTLPSNLYQSDQSNDVMNVSHSNVPLSNQPLFNNSAPPAQLNPNVLSSQSVPQPIQNNRNPNCLLNLTPHVAMNNPHLMGTQTLSGQSTALNNQVPPGNRANNYWDNFRSYSRQNLLSGSSKSNADPAFPTHSPHPLVERSHNTLHSGAPSAAPGTAQATNTPKRNVNNVYPSGAPHNSQSDISFDSGTQRRGRRNLSQETEYFTAPPDVLNVNQNLDAEPNQLLSNLLSNSEEPPPGNNRFHSLVNVNVNRLSTNPIPEIIQAHSNNLNLPRSNGAHKKKSSSKLPAKNSSNAGNYSLDYAHNRNVETNVSNEVFNPNLASTSSSNSQEKSTTKLFDLLRENVYSEVTALISANESRPHFLIQLFRDLQQISSDTLRQRALQSIQELISHYLLAVESESYEASEDHRSLRRNTSGSQNQGVPIDESVVIDLDIPNEMVRFILSHHSEICSDELIESLRHIVMATRGNHIDQSQLDQNLRDCFVKFRGCKLEDVSDDLLIAISRILSAADLKNQQSSSTATESSGEIAQALHSEERHLSYQENTNERGFPQHLLGNSEMGAASNAASMIGSQNEAMGLYSPPSSSSHEASNRYGNMPESKIDLIESVETYNGDLAEADQSRHGSETTATSGDGGLDGLLPDVVDTEEQTPTEAEAEWLGLDRVPTRLQMEDPGNQSDSSQA